MKKVKFTSSCLFIGIVVLLVCLAVFKIISDKKLAYSLPDQPTVSITPRISPTPTTILGLQEYVIGEEADYDYTGWRKYTQSKGHFEIMLPPDVITKEVDYGSPNCGNELLIVRKEIGFDVKFGSNISISRSCIKAEYFPTRIFSNISTGQMKNTVLDGITGYSQIGLADLFKLGGSINLQRVSVYTNGFAFTSDNLYLPQGRVSDKVFNQMLASFKIIK